MPGGAAASVTSLAFTGVPCVRAPNTHLLTTRSPERVCAPNSGSERACGKATGGGVLMWGVHNPTTVLRLGHVAAFRWQHCPQHPSSARCRPGRLLRCMRARCDAACCCAARCGAALRRWAPGCQVCAELHHGCYGDRCPRQGLAPTHLRAPRTRTPSQQRRSSPCASGTQVLRSAGSAPPSCCRPLGLERHRQPAARRG